MQQLPGPEARQPCFRGKRMPTFLLLPDIEPLLRRVGRERQVVAADQGVGPGGQAQARVVDHDHGQLEGLDPERDHVAVLVGVRDLEADGRLRDLALVHVVDVSRAEVLQREVLDLLGGEALVLEVSARDVLVHHREDDLRRLGVGVVYGQQILGREKKKELMFKPSIP